MEERPPRRFIIGAILIGVSLALGKLVLIPIIFFPGSDEWRASMLIVYIFSWVILVIGIFMCGMEGYRFAKKVYKDYQHRTITKVKHHSKKAAQKTVEVIASKARSGLDKMRKKPDQPQ
jgi:phosphate/sulfate permease